MIVKKYANNKVTNILIQHASLEQQIDFLKVTTKELSLFKKYLDYLNLHEHVGDDFYSDRFMMNLKAA
eukprot:Pgem_evm1s4847